LSREGEEEGKLGAARAAEEVQRILRNREKNARGDIGAYHEQLNIHHHWDWDLFWYPAGEK
jgi:hypothetical protein